MNYDFHQVVAGYLEVAVGILIATAILKITHSYEKRNNRRMRLLEIQSEISKAYHYICDSRWICRPRSLDNKAYHQLLTVIGSQRGFFVNALHEFKTAKLLDGEDLKTADKTLKEIDCYLLNLLQESTRFDENTGFPQHTKKELEQDTVRKEFPFYCDFISVWSTITKQGKECIANEKFRKQFQSISQIIEKNLQE